MGEWRYGSTRSAFSRWLEQSAQLHGPSALLAGKTLSVPIVGGGGDRHGTVVKVQCYKSEGRWFDPSWCQSIFH